MAFGSLSHSTVIIHGKRYPHDAPSPLVRYPGAALWVVTNAVPRYWDGHLPGWTEAFNVHPDNMIPEQTHEWYRSLPIDRPVWLKAERSDVPASRRFPMAELRERFPREPFGCTDDAVIALAIARGARRIVLDGIGTTDDPLFQYLHRTLWHWIGYARGAGIDVVVNEPSCFATRDLYGYDRLGHAEMAAFNAAWESGTQTANYLGPLCALLDRLATTSTLSPLYAESVKVAARAYFREQKYPQHDDNGGNRHGTQDLQAQGNRSA